jgi:hypothetical protein
MLLFLSMVLSASVVYGGTSSTRSKEEIVRWCAQNREAIRFVGYQGSDRKQHHYIVRVMDSWTFFQIQREELAPKDERPFPSASSAQMYYYLVDPLHEFEKLKQTKEANQPFETTETAARSPRLT